MQAVQLTHTTSCTVLKKQFRPHRATVRSKSVMLPSQTLGMPKRQFVSSRWPPLSPLSKAKIAHDKNGVAVGVQFSCGN